jgi:hypothetical protein
MGKFSTRMFVYESSFKNRKGTVKHKYRRFRTQERQ